MILTTLFERFPLLVFLDMLNVAWCPPVMNANKGQLRNTKIPFPSNRFKSVFSDIYVPKCWVDLSFNSSVILEFFLFWNCKFHNRPNNLGLSRHQATIIIHIKYYSQKHTAHFTCANSFVANIRCEQNLKFKKRNT